MLRLVEGEELLELVHKHDQPVRVWLAVEGQAREQVQAMGLLLRGGDDRLKRKQVLGELHVTADGDLEALPGVSAGAELHTQPAGAVGERAVFENGGQKSSRREGRLTTAGRTNQGQEAAFAWRAEMLLLASEDLLDERIAAEEESGVRLAEGLETDVRAVAGEGRASRRVSGRLAENATLEAMEGVCVVEGLLEFDPGGALEEGRQLALGGALSAWKNHGQNAQAVLPVGDPAADGESHLFIVPRANAAWAEEDDAYIAGGEGVFESHVPRVTRYQVPLIEPARYASGFKPARELLHCRFVGAVMRQERWVA